MPNTAGENPASHIIVNSTKDNKDNAKLKKWVKIISVLRRAFYEIKMRKRHRAILKFVAAGVVFFALHYLVYALLIQPGLTNFYADKLSDLYLAQAALAVFAITNIALVAILVASLKLENASARAILGRLIYYLLLFFFTLAFFTFPQIALSTLIEIFVFFTAFAFALLIFDFALYRIKLKLAWRQIIICSLVFLMLTSVLWFNPYFKAISSDFARFKTAVNFALDINPALVILHNIAQINIFRSGHFYSNLGAENLSIIGDYYALVEYWGSGYFLGFLYILLASCFFALISAIKFARKKLRKTNSEP